jgi:hypothetical protein
MLQIGNRSFPFCLSAFASGLSDVERILRVAPQKRASANQPRKTAEAMYRAATVLTCATWEAYIEDLAIEALRRVVDRYRAGNALIALGQEVGVRTSRVMERAGVRIQDPSALVAARNTILRCQFNAPKTANINNLFKGALDLEDMSSAWSHSGVTASIAGRRLDSFVTLRHDIAHRKRSAENVSKADLVANIHLLEGLSVLTCNRVREWLVDAQGESPTGWDPLPITSVA